MSQKPEQLLAQTHLAIRQLRSMLTDSSREYRDRIRRLEKIQESLVNASIQPEGELLPATSTISPDDLALVRDPARGL